jgi:hypothetical protein
MKLPRRQFLHLAAGAAALPVLSRVAWAQPYPARPITMLVPFPAGGGTDAVARTIVCGHHLDKPSSSVEVPARRAMAIPSLRAAGTGRQWRGLRSAIQSAQLFLPNRAGRNSTSRNCHKEGCTG